MDSVLAGIKFTAWDCGIWGPQDVPNFARFLWKLGHVGGEQISFYKITHFVGNARSWGLFVKVIIDVSRKWDLTTWSLVDGGEWGSTLSFIVFTIAKRLEVQKKNAFLWVADICENYTNVPLIAIQQKISYNIGYILFYARLNPDLSS